MQLIINIESHRKAPKPPGGTGSGTKGNIMRNWMLSGLVALSFATAASAHEVWIERDATGPARIYLGEPGDPVPEGGDPEFARLKAPKLIGDHGTPIRRTTHIEVPLNGAGDLRLVDDAVFAPWKGEKGGYEGAIFHARAGRAETRALLDLEFVPVAANGDRFTVVYQGKPVAGARVSILNPDGWAKTFAADGQGIVAVPADRQGRYLLTVNHSVDGPRALGGQSVAKVHHVSTLSFVAP